jgi:hypothetical protein
MSYRDIIHEAWVFTQNHKRLIYWYGFLPSIFTTSIGVLYLAYQFLAFKQSELFNHRGHSFLYDAGNFVVKFMAKNSQWGIPLVGIAIVVVLIYFLLPTLAQGAAIQYIARKKNGQEIGVRSSLKYGFLHFLPLLEYHLMIKTFGFFSLLFEGAFVLRNFGVSAFNVLLPFFLIFMIIGLILTLLFTYADFYIVIDNDPVFVSIRKSIRLVIFHWQKTFFITLLMIVIGIRIILQILLLLLVPALILFVGGYVATLTLAALGIAIGCILGILALFFASYLGGVVDIFAYTVWTFTFLELTSEKEISARESA